MNSYLWRHVVAALAPQRRCIAVDLPGHGRTPAAVGQNLSLTGLADLLGAFCEALELPPVDLVGNDTGCAICQVFAARHGERLRTLTLTNGEVEGALPAPAALPLFEAARAGRVAALVHRMATDHAFARSRAGLGTGFEHPELLDDRDLDVYLESFATVEGGRGLERLMTSLDEADLRASRPALAEFRQPTLVVWGASDVYFDTSLAYQLRDLIPGTRQVVELTDAMLFFPDERADELLPLLVRHWESPPLR